MWRRWLADWSQIIQGVGFIVTLIGGGFLAFYGWVMTMCQNFVLAILVFIFGAVLLGTVGLLTRERKSGIHFFENRDALNKKTGGIHGEIQTSDQAWLVTFVAAHASDHEVFQLSKLNRLILLDPRGSFVEKFSLSFNRKAEEIKGKIRETTRQARKFGVEVHWYDGPITSTLILNPDMENASARVEIDFPFMNAADRPSLRIDKSKFPNVFNEIKRSFDELWHKSKKAPIEPDEIERGIQEGKDFIVQ